MTTIGENNGLYIMTTLSLKAKYYINGNVLKCLFYIYINGNLLKCLFYIYINGNVQFKVYNGTVFSL